MARERYKEAITGEYICTDCGVIVLPDTRTIHDQWHTSLDERIAAASKVGEYGDMMNRPIGGWTDYHGPMDTGYP